MREYVVYPVEDTPQERYGPRVYTGDGQWATVFEVVYAAEDWFRRNEAGVPITARRREWEFTEVTWPSGQAQVAGVADEFERLMPDRWRRLTGPYADPERPEFRGPHHMQAVTCSGGVRLELDLVDLSPQVAAQIAALIAEQEER